MSIHNDQTFFIIDYETTGVSIDKDFPIEIGIIITDSKFVILDTYSNYINTCKSFLNEGECTWDNCSRGKEAYPIHNIKVDTIISMGLFPNNIVDDIIDLTENYKVKNKKPIIVSDNIQFEYSFTRKLFKLSGYNEILENHFHYCGWDTSLLLISTGVGDPKGVSHRAFDDAAILHQHIIRAMDRINAFK